MRNKILTGVFAIFFLVASIFGYMLAYFLHAESQIVFLDVGQGDSILITQGSKQVLIDGGRNGIVLLERLGKYIPFWDRRIEMIVETHPDQDHIGGLINVFDTYDIETVLKTNAHSDSQTYNVLLEKEREEKSEIILATEGEKIIFGENAALEILHPFSGQSTENVESNAASIVGLFTFENEKFLLTGDLASEQEYQLIQKYPDLRATVLKAGHHGSKSSSGENFLKIIGARDAVISVGAKNMYGHPHPETLARLLGQGMRILRTDQEGDILYRCFEAKQSCKRQYP